MDEIKETGQSVIVTKRGVPMVRVSPVENTEKNDDDLFGDLAETIEVVGGPHDLIRPAFELNEWDMLK